MIGIIACHGLPDYLVSIVTDYLREIIYLDRDNVTHRRALSCDVSSVLGPLLWDITYDAVLRRAFSLECYAICYADDSLIISEGEIGGTMQAAKIAVCIAVDSVRELGLK